MTTPGNRSKKEVLFRCWSRGDNIRTTMHSLQVYAGVSLDFETVRLAFVDLSEQFLSAPEGVK